MILENCTVLSPEQVETIRRFVDETCEAGLADGNILTPDDVLAMSMMATILQVALLQEDGLFSKPDPSGGMAN